MTQPGNDPAPPPPAPPPGRITWRAIALGLGLTVCLAVVTPYSDYIRRSPFLIGNHLPLIVVTTITLLCALINPLLGRRRFTAVEMVTAIAMMLIACALPTSGLFRYFTPQLADTVYQATGGQAWYNDYLKLLPNWMLPSKDPGSSIVRDYFLGVDRIDPHALAATWRQWAVPYLAWTFFLGPLFLCLMFICALLRKQWVERERLSFPMATIPLEMMREPEPGRRFAALWRNPLLWIAVLVPFTVHLLNGAHIFFPSIPEVPIKFDLSKTTLSDYPWNLLPYFMRANSISFSVVAITFFIPVDVAFSIWAFYVAYNLLIVFAATSGVEVKWEHRLAHGGGIWLAYGLALVWISRHHLLHVAKAVWRWDRREPGEPLSYPACVVGIAVTAALAIGFMIAAGMTWWMALAVFAALVLWSLIVTRIVIEAGVALITMPVDPLYLWTWLLPGVSVGVQKIIWMRNWLIASLTTHAAFSDSREQLMPFAANALRLGSALPFSQRRKHFLTLVAALALCALVSGGIHHYLSYSFGRQAYDDDHSSMAFPRGTMDAARAAAEPDLYPPKINPGPHLAAGAAAVLVVTAVRAFSTAIPVHPIGLLLLNTYSGDRLWLSVFLGWAINLIILRWGGIKVFRAARPVFIGLLVGDSLAGVFWSVVGLYATWPPGVRYEILFK